MAIHPTAEIEEGAIICGDVSIWQYCHVRKNAFIGVGVSLGRNVFVDSGAFVRPYARLQNNISVYSGVDIGDFCFVGPHVVFTNDKRPRVGQPWEICKTEVKHHASIGAGVTVVCGFTIGEYAMIGAGTVVCRDILPYEQVVKFSEHVGFVDKDGTLIK